MSEDRDFQQSDGNTIINIIKNYVQNEKAIVNQLHFTTSHGTTIGGFREDIWRGMFKQIVPKKFVIEQSVFIMDSQGRVSNEVDLAIFDETYTPYIFHYGRLKFLPIEAVAVVIECKSSSLNQEILSNWVKSVEVLRTSSNSYTRIYNKIAIGEMEPETVRNSTKLTQTSTRPLRILCCLNETIVNRTLESGEALFDFVIRATSEKERLLIEKDEDKQSLQDWYLALNHVGYQRGQDEKGDSFVNEGDLLGEVKLDEYQVHKKDGLVSLLTFNLQLNQVLMMINNPILFPHKAYAKLFDQYGREADLDDK